MKAKLEALKQNIISELKRTDTLEQLEAIHSKYFSRASGELGQLSKDLKQVAQAQKPVVGKLLNDVKLEAEKIFMEVKEKINSNRQSPIANRQLFDSTLPGFDQGVGKMHILSQMQYQIEEIFKQMGFLVLDGPQLESDWYNFEALNVPQDHPARDIQDTFYIKNPKSEIRNPKSELVMRTHTSNVQVRAMEKHGVPLKCIGPGRVFRNEATDARHEHTFYQIEGLMVDQDISIANLKAVVDTIVKAMLGQDFKTRIRPGYFPFVEPGLEVDMSCTICKGRGCRVCKHSGWVELMGAGMVHRDVLAAAGVDANQYSGFAFGFGLERITMMKYNIDDIRLFESGDLRFLEQF